MSISAKEIWKVFSLEPLSDYHIPTDLPTLEKEYLSKKDTVRQGAMRTYLASIRNFPFVTASIKETFKKEFFTSRALEIYI